MKTLSKILVCFVVTLALTGGILDAAPTIRRAYAQTTKALQSQIDILRVQNALVQSQLGIAQPGASGIPLAFRFERTLKSGARGEDVRYLQILLNRDAETGVNAPGLIGGAGNETDFFGAATKRAVINFQNKYAAEVLRPAGLQSGTGTVGLFTRAKLDALLSRMAESRISVAAPLLVVATTSSPAAIELEKNSPATSTLPAISFEEINTKTRTALVNIICTTIRSGSFNPVSGSGVFIDSKGVILTNAHVAQYFLLKDYLVPNFVSCVIRTGEPARNRYKARLLYIAPQWVERNRGKIVEKEPTGTGEHDFALLLITESVNPEVPLPSTYPAVMLDVSDTPLRRKSEVLVAGYPAGFLGGISIQKELYPVSSIARTGRLYSFGSTTPDIISVAGSPLAQQGASGGAVVTGSGALIGLISTASTGATTGERELFAITGAHLERSFAERNEFSIRSMLGNANFAQLADEFNKNVAPQLTKLLESELKKP